MAANHEGNQASTNYKEAFSLFDKRGNGRVALDSLGDLLRACGQNPTLSEIRDLEKNVGGDCESPIYFSISIFIYDRQFAQFRDTLLPSYKICFADIFCAVTQSTSRPSSAYSTGRAASVTRANPRNTAGVSRCSIRT